MKKILFSTVAASALLGVNLYANDIQFLATLDTNDQFLNWQATPSQIDAKFNDIKTLDYWKGIEATKTLASTLEEKVKDVADAKTALGGDGSKNRGIYKDIEAKTKQMTDNKTGFEAFKAVSADVENKKVADLTTYFEGLVGSGGTLTTAKTNAEKALNDATTLLGTKQENAKIEITINGTKNGGDFGSTASATLNSTGLYKAQDLHSIIEGQKSTLGDILGADGKLVTGKLGASTDTAETGDDKSLWAQYKYAVNNDADTAEIKKKLEAALKVDEANKELDKLTFNGLNDKTSSTINSEITKLTGEDSVDGSIKNLESKKTTAESNFNAVENNKNAVKTYLKAKEDLGSESEASSLLGQKKEFEAIIQAAEDARKALEDAIKQTNEYKNIASPSTPGGEAGSNPSTTASEPSKEEIEAAAASVQIALESILDKNTAKLINSNENIAKSMAKADILANSLTTKPSKSIYEGGLSELKKKEGLSEADTKTIAKIETQIKTALNEAAKSLAEHKKDDLRLGSLSTLNAQINNMNKRLGEVRGLDGDIGAWLRIYGTKSKSNDKKSTTYSTQIGADKKLEYNSGDLIVGALLGYDKGKADYLKSDTYSAGIYASFIANEGYFFDAVLKYANTKFKHDLASTNKVNMFLASLEAGYRVNVNDNFYVEPSLEFITGHIGKYEEVSKNSTNTIKSFTPFVFKPQAFIGYSVDNFTARFGVGGVLNLHSKPTANTLLADFTGNGLAGESDVKLKSYDYGFASIGFSYKLSDNLRFNLGFEHNFGNENKSYELNSTIRYTF